MCERFIPMGTRTVSVNREGLIVNRGGVMFPRGAFEADMTQIVVQFKIFAGKSSEREGGGRPQLLVAL